MRSALRCFVAAWLFATGTFAMGADTVRVTETRSVPPEYFPKAAAATHDLKLSLYAFKNSHWKPDDIVNAVVEALPLIAQCGVNVASFELRVLDTPVKYHFFS